MPAWNPCLSNVCMGSKGDTETSVSRPMETRQEQERPKHTSPEPFTNPMSKPSDIEYLQALQQMSFSSCSHPYFCTNASDILFYFIFISTATVFLFSPDLFLYSGTWDGRSCLKSVLHTLWELSLELLDLPREARKKMQEELALRFSSPWPKLDL